MRFATLALPFLLPATLQAQWAAPGVNTPVHAASGLDAVTPLSAPGPDGSTYICWFESVSSSYVLKMQRLDVDGNALWDPAGLLVSDEPQNSALFRYDLKSDHAGNAIVAFQDERTGTLDVVVSKVAPDGGLPWGNGISLPTPDGTGLAPVIGVLEDDRVVVAWNADPASQVAFRVLPATGVPAAEEPTLLAVSGRSGRPRVISTSDNGFWLQYVAQTGNFLSPGTMYAQHYSESGAPGTPIMLSTKTIQGFYFPDPLPDGHDGLYIAFNTGNNANANLTDVYVQRLRSTGSLWSATGTAVETGSSTQRYTGTATPALVSDDAGVMMAYSRTNTAQSAGGIAVQRFDTAGTTLLGANGVELVVSSDALPTPFANAPVSGGIVMAGQSGGFGEQVLMGLEVDLNGIISGQGSLMICSAVSGKDDATLVPFRNGQAVAVWHDERAASGIYAQNIVSTGFSGVNGPEGWTPGTLLGALGERPELLFGERIGPALLTVVAADGRPVLVQNLRAAAAGTRIALDGSSWASGLYHVVLTTATDRQVMRWARP